MPNAAQAPGRAARARPDFATLAGIAVAVAGIIGGLILESGSVQDILQATAAMIVAGGTFGAVLVTTPLPLLVRAVKALRSLVIQPPGSAPETIETLIHFATNARKFGIVSLESEAAEIPDPFMRKAMNLAVDGADLQEIRSIMEVDIALMEQAREAEARVWESAGGYAPTIGIIGAVMGLIQVMKHLEDIRAVGHGIAVAFVATLYGVGSANLFLLPAAGKLRARMREAVSLKEMTLEGVTGIVEGLNPKLIREKLIPYHPGPVKRARAAAKGLSAVVRAPSPASAAVEN